MSPLGLACLACGASVALGWLSRFDLCHPIVRSLVWLESATSQCVAPRISCVSVSRCQQLVALLLITALVSWSVAGINSPHNDSVLTEWPWIMQIFAGTQQVYLHFLMNIILVSFEGVKSTANSFSWIELVLVMINSWFCNPSDNILNLIFTFNWGFQ